MKRLPTTLPRFFWHFTKPYLFSLLVIQLLCFSWSLDQTLWPWVLECVVDTLSNFTGDRAFMWKALALPLWLGAILWIGNEVFNRLAGRIMAKIFPSIEASVRKEMFQYVQQHSYTYFSDHLAGSLSNKISDIVQALTDILKAAMTTFLPVFLAALISTVLFLKLSPLFASILLGWIVIHLAICYYFSKGCDAYSDIHSEARSELSGRIVDSLTNNITVKLFSRHKDELNLLGNAQKDEKEKHETSLLYVEKMKLVLGIIAFLIPGALLNWYMLYSWQKGYITTGAVVFIFNTSWNIIGMIYHAGQQLPDLFREIGRAKQALSIIQDEHDIVDHPKSTPLSIPKGEIIFDHVTFNHNSNQTLFQNKTLMIEAGQKVGLVGFSGSGKSTFANLILRFYEPASGRILIDGQDISEVTQESLRKNIAMIPQDASLFHRTLFENIQYGRMDATLDEVIDASKKAYCHEFIERLPEQYDTYVGERGTKLSGGQRQRIALARAILKNAPILIFDEATSALDSVTEKYIQDAFKQLMQGRTTIVIAHRLSTLSDMDRILVFNKGEIIEDGTHYELLDAQGHYATMWNMQAEGFLPE